jgi:hypothetical protein
MYSASRVVLKTISSPQISKLAVQSSTIYTYSKSCTSSKDVQLSQQHDPKKIRNVRGCVPAQQNTDIRMIRNYAKLNEQKVMQDERCAINFM